MVPRMHDTPSIAALVVPWDPGSALERLGRALAARGLLPHKTALPVGYKPAPSEWIGAVALPLPPLRRGRESLPNAAIVSTDVARVFTLAMWLSASQPEDVIVAWRRFAGFEPCTKVFWGGMPRWKHGEDPDHEVAFQLPQGQPAEVRPPTDPRVPLDATLIGSMLAAVVKPLKDPLKSGGQSWLHRSSILS
jgi:hypothetical protein